jgi:hypothetical protein
LVELEHQYKSSHFLQTLLDIDNYNVHDYKHKKQTQKKQNEIQNKNKPITNRGRYVKYCCIDNFSLPLTIITYYCKTCWTR